MSRPWNLGGPHNGVSIHDFTNNFTNPIGETFYRWIKSKIWIQNFAKVYYRVIQKKLIRDEEPKYLDLTPRCRVRRVVLRESDFVRIFTVFHT